jgi:hypothetical protein
VAIVVVVVVVVTPSAEIDAGRSSRW